jgi:hypothetical protein
LARFSRHCAASHQTRYIDTRGKTRIPNLACTSAGEFRGGLAPVQVEDDETGETRWGYIGKKGKYVWKPRA